MKKSALLFLVVISVLFSCNSSTKIETYSTSDYTIDYPYSWDLDTSGQYNTEFLLFSNSSITDIFRENINLTTENLPKNTTLSQYADAAKKQIAPVPKVKIFSSEITHNNGNEVLEIVWQGYVNNSDLKFKQQCHIKDSKAYIVTFTAKQTTYDDYQDTATKILNSFTLN